MTEPREPPWLLLIHQIPPKPNYLRVKVGRRLQALGAVAVKNSVYVLPRGDQSLEDLQWVRREIMKGGGEATVCEARFVEGHSDADIEGLFNAAREADYSAVAEDARRLQRFVSARPGGAQRPRKKSVAGLSPARRTQRPEATPDPGQSLLRLRKRLAEVSAIDFFGAGGRETVEALLLDLEARLRTKPAEAEARGPLAAAGIRGRTWVTRRGVHVDRIGCAWLIRRFIDPEARFKFVPVRDHAPEPGEVRFDMFEAEFTHDGDLCSFEVLLRDFGLQGTALRHLGEIVHDIDLKDGKFGRPEALGLDRLVAGIAMRHKDDEARLAEGAVVFEALHEYFSRKKV